MRPWSVIFAPLPALKHSLTWTSVQVMLRTTMAGTLPELSVCYLSEGVSRVTCCQQMSWPKARKMHLEFRIQNLLKQSHHYCSIPTHYMTRGSIITDHQEHLENLSSSPGKSHQCLDTNSYKTSYPKQSIKLTILPRVLVGHGRERLMLFSDSR